MKKRGPPPLHKCLIRKCERVSLDVCCICNLPIVVGECYYDGGWARRAHVWCTPTSWWPAIGIPVAMIAIVIVLAWLLFQ